VQRQVITGAFGELSHKIRQAFDGIFAIRHCRALRPARIVASLLLKQRGAFPIIEGITA
jgi:hypothetical protein